MSAMVRSVNGGGRTEEKDGKAYSLSGLMWEYDCRRTVGIVGELT